MDTVPCHASRWRLPRIRSEIGLAVAGAARQCARAYDNEVAKRSTAEITKTTDIFKRLTQRDVSLADGRGSVCLTRKWIPNCKPIDRLAVSHVLRVKCAGASIDRSRDDE
jgi:hypothetical protein